MVKIRLSRLGSKGKIYYRIVAVDEKRKRSGKALDTLGFWNPIKSLKSIDQEKLKYWKNKGAIVTKAIQKLLEK